MKVKSKRKTTDPTVVEAFLPSTEEIVRERGGGGLGCSGMSWHNLAFKCELHKEKRHCNMGAMKGP